MDLWIPFYGNNWFDISESALFFPGTFHMAVWQRNKCTCMDHWREGCRIPKPLTATSALSAIVCPLNTHALTSRTHRNTYLYTCLHTCVCIHSQTLTHTHLLKWSATHSSYRNIHKLLSRTYSQIQNCALVPTCNKRQGYNAIVFRPEECEQSVPSGMWMNQALWDYSTIPDKV